MSAVKIDVEKIMADYNITKAEVASVLFPNAKYKRKCIQRVITGKQDLKINQINDLAKFLNIDTISLLQIKNNSNGTN